jgi:formylglycine-generating enzyme required for sulfatase activity
MSVLACSHCGERVEIRRSACAYCGTRYDAVKCKSCGATGGKSRFQSGSCPDCGEDVLLAIQAGDADVEEVGADAFLDAPSPEDIERGFEVRPEPEAEKSPRSGPASAGRPAADRRPVRRARGDADDEAPAPTTSPPKPLRRSKWEGKEETEAKPALPKPKSVKQEAISTRPRRGLSLQLDENFKRYALYGGLVVLGLVGVYGLLNTLMAPGKPARRPAAGAAAAGGGDTALEGPAQLLYSEAVESARRKQIDPALNKLRELVVTYPNTKSAARAQEALKRHARGEPLFPGLAPLAQYAPIEAKPAESTPEPEPQIAPGKIGIPREFASAIDPTASATESTPTAASGTSGAARRGSTLPRADVMPRPLPEGFEPVDESGLHASGWPIEIVCLRDQSRMMLVPAGPFEMGQQNGAADERPVHTVKLRTYYIDKFEVTVGQYQLYLDECRKAGQTGVRELPLLALTVAHTTRHPAVGISYRDAAAFAAWAGKSIPTEAQWEKAARGIEGHLFPWGAAAETGSPASGQMVPVGTVRGDLSPYGVHDLGGNVWEWCSDWYDAAYYQTSPAADPPGQALPPPALRKAEPRRTLRGGASDGRSTWRRPGSLAGQSLQIGFRCVLDIGRIAPEEQAAISSPPTKAAETPQTVPATPPPSTPPNAVRL